MFTKNIKDSFTANLLSAVSGVLGEAKKCKDCGCAKCKCDEPEETKEGYVSGAQRRAVWANRADDGKGHPDKKKKMKKEGYMPTNDAPSDEDRKTAGKLSNLLKRERDAKEKKEPNGVKTEEADMPFEKPYKKVGDRKDEYGNKVKNVAKHLAKKAMKANEEVEEIEEAGLWANIHAKRKRIKAGSGERMRKVGEKGAPTVGGIKSASNEEVSLDDAFEQLEEASTGKNKQYVEITHLLGHKSRVPVHPTMAYKALNRYRNDPSTKSARIVSEDSEQIDELSVAKLDQYRSKARTDIIDADANDDNRMYNKRTKGYVAASKKVSKKLASEEIDPDLEAELKATRVTKKSIEDSKKNRGVKEEVEELDEISNKTLGTYRANAYNDYIKKSANRMPGEAETDAMKKRKNSLELANKKLAKEEVIDELSKATMGRYINKAKDSIDTASYRQGNREALGGSSRPLERKLSKRHKGISTAVSKLTKEEQDFIDSLNTTDMEQIAELSKATMGSYIKKASGAEQPKNVMSPKNVPLTKIAAYQGDSETGHFGKRFNQATYDKADRLRKNRSQGITRAADKLAKEEVEVIDEARGRPKKAGARDFTIHPRTKEKLMHDNPEHMARIERLQKNKVLTKPKVEANQNIIQQLQRAKLSMRGGETVNFTHGDPHHVAGTHAARLLDKHGGMKPAEKEAFQKKIGHSHAKLKSEL